MVTALSVYIKYVCRPSTIRQLKGYIQQQYFVSVSRYDAKQCRTRGCHCALQILPALPSFVVIIPH